MVFRTSKLSIFIQVLPPVGLDSGQSPCNLPLPTPNRLGKLDLIEQAHGQVLNRIDYVSLLASVIGVFTQPANEARPARQLSQVPRQVFRPSFVGYSEPIEAGGNGILRRVGQIANFLREVLDAEEPTGKVPLRQLAPVLIKPAISAGHGPASDPLIDKGRNPGKSQ